MNQTVLASNFPDILALCETNFDDLIDSGNFSMRSYLLFIWKDSITHMHGLIVYLKEGASFSTGFISRKLCAFLLMFSTGFTSPSVLFSFYPSPSSSLGTVFDSISSNIWGSLDQLIFLLKLVFVLQWFSLH